MVAELRRSNQDIEPELRWPETLQESKATEISSGDQSNGLDGEALSVSEKSIPESGTASSSAVWEPPQWPTTAQRRTSIAGRDRSRGFGERPGGDCHSEGLRGCPPVPVAAAVQPTTTSLDEGPEVDEEILEVFLLEAGDLLTELNAQLTAVEAEAPTGKQPLS